MGDIGEFHISFHVTSGKSNMFLDFWDITIERSKAAECQILATILQLMGLDLLALDGLDFTCWDGRRDIQDAT